MTDAGSPLVPVERKPMSPKHARQLAGLHARPRYRKTRSEQFMSRKGIAAFLWAAHDLRAEVGPLPYFAFACQYLLGLRIGEVILLRYDHVRRMADGWPVIFVPTLKKPSRVRHRDVCDATGKPLFPVPVLSHRNLVEAAFGRAFRPPKLRESPWLFPDDRDPMTHWSRFNAYRYWNMILDHSGLPDYYTPHALRHSAGTYLHERCERRRIVAAFLRHDLGGRHSGEEGPSVTDRYIHLTEEAWRKYRGALDLPTLAPL